MRHFDRKSLGIGLVLMALLMCISSRGYAYQISVYPDSVFMTTATGTSTDAYVYISDGRDTTQPNLTLGSVSVTLEASAGSGFTMLTDSVLHFVGLTVVHIRYSPTSNNNSTGQLLIQSDSTTAYVALVGTVTQFTPQIQVQLGNYDSLVRNQKYCQNFTVYNPNPDAITITAITVTDYANNTHWSIENEVSLPVSISSHSTLPLGELCALLSTDSSNIFGMLEIDYTYDGSSHSGGASLNGRGEPASSTCVTVDGIYSVSASAGGSVDSWFLLTNTTDTSIYLSNADIVGDSSVFTLNSPSFPLTLAPDSSVRVHISFAPPSGTTQDNYSATFEASVYGTSRDGLACSPVSVPLSGTVNIPIVDSITLDIPPGSNTLSITAHTTKSRHALFIHNSGTNQLLLESIAVSSSDSTVTAGFPPYDGGTEDLYDSLAAGATTGMNGPVILELNAPDTGTYDLTITLTYTVQQAYQKGATPQSNSLTYTVTAHRLPPLAAGVSEPSVQQTVEFTLSPNPAQGEVTIGLPEDGASNVEIYDVLGNLIFRGTERSSFVWNGTIAGSSIPNGAYIVRVSQGNRVSSQRLMLER